MDYKKLTLEELINKAKVNENKDEELEIYIERLQATVKIKKPSNELILNSIENSKENPHDGDLYLLYNSIIESNVKDNRLHEAYNITRPIEILDKIFNLGEIGRIAQIIMETAGYSNNSVKLIDELKN